MNTRRAFEFSYQLKSGKVDRAGGLLPGVTVAKAGVQATGKFLFLDAAGKPTADEAKAKQKLPMFTDEKTLTTLLGAAQDAGGKVKVRSDHDDKLEARAGFAAKFFRDGDRVACDIQLYKSYKDREIVLETADETPEMIGCSIDFTPSFEIKDGKAFMRVEELSAVDIVDAGAITHGGLFMSRSVDNENKEDLTQLKITMAKPDEKTAPTVEDCMKALTGLSETVTGLAEAFKKMGTTPPAAMSVEQIGVQLAALKTSQDTFQAEQKQALVDLRKERVALGISPEKLKVLENVADETEKVRLAAEAAKADTSPKNYLAAVEAKATALKIEKSQAHRLVQSEHPELYQKHLAARGVVKLTLAA